MPGVEKAQQAEVAVRSLRPTTSERKVRPLCEETARIELLSGNSVANVKSMVVASSDLILANSRRALRTDR